MDARFIDTQLNHPSDSLPSLLRISKKYSRHVVPTIIILQPVSHKFTLYTMEIIFIPFSSAPCGMENRICYSFSPIWSNGDIVFFIHLDSRRDFNAHFFCGVSCPTSIPHVVRRTMEHIGAGVIGLLSGNDNSDSITTRK